MSVGPPGPRRSPDVELAHRALVDRGLIEPLALGGGDEALWLDCELASLAENRLGEVANPLRLDASKRESLLAHATVEPLYAPSDRDIDRCYWLLDGADRAGTIALATDLLGAHAMRLASLYVLPSKRGLKIGTGVLAAVRDAAGSLGLGVRLTTSWSWQRTLRLYVALGMWVRRWTREIELEWGAHEPAPIVDVLSDFEVRLCVEQRGERVELTRARRSGDDLLLRTYGGVSPLLSTQAVSTLALHLALRGWPLVRSARHWTEHHLSDAGAPEALAYRIMVWEAWDRAHGFRVDTPRIHGLHYPTWTELEAGLSG